MQDKKQTDNKDTSSPPEVYGNAFNPITDRMDRILSSVSARKAIIMVLALIGVTSTAFVIAGRPAASFDTAPTLKSPAYGATVSQSPTFSWEAMKGAGGYELAYAVAVDEDFEKASTQNIGRKSNDFTSSDLVQGEYIWRVRATGRKNSVSPWSDTWSFTYVSEDDGSNDSEPPAEDEPELPPGDDDPPEEPPEEEEPPTPPITEFPDPLWHADADTNGEDAWKGQQEAYPDRLSIVDDPLGRFGKVYQALMKDGDLYKDRARAEWYGSEMPDGDDMKLVLESPNNLWFGWRSYVNDGIFAPTNWANAGNIMQLKGDSSCGGPAIGLTFKYGRLTLRSELYDILWNGPEVSNFTGDWRDFVLHVNFSKDADVGYVELWYDGVKQAMEDGTTKYEVATMCPNDEYVYLKMGIYRNSGIEGTDYHWVESPRIGESYESVVPR